MLDLLNFVKYAASIIFFALLIVGSTLARQMPDKILALAVVLITLGTPLAVYGFHELERYRSVYDFEPAQFWNKTRNGKEAREALMSVSVVGLGSALAGLVLVTVVLMHIQLIPVPF